MGTLLNTIQSDIQKITSNLNEYGVSATFTAPDTTQATLTVIHTKHHLGYDTDGNQVNTKNAHLSVSEQVLIDASYPVRDLSGEVNLRDHRVVVADSTGINHEYVIRECFTDEIISLIVCILVDFE